MGANDTSEQLSAAKAEVVRLERELAESHRSYEWLHAKEGKAGALAQKHEAERDALAATLDAVRKLADQGGLVPMRDLRAILDSSPAQHQTERDGKYGHCPECAFSAGHADRCSLGKQGEQSNG